MLFAEGTAGGVLAQADMAGLPYDPVSEHTCVIASHVLPVDS